jgi:AraC-like DNA-binding protein
LSVLHGRGKVTGTMSEVAALPEVVAPRVQRFTTSGLRETDRIQQWEAHNAKALVGLEARTISGTPLEATELNLQFETLQFAHVSANAHIVERGSRQIARMPSDNVALYFTLFGESVFYYRDGVHLQRPGGLLVCDTNEPFMRGFARGLREFVLTIPRITFEQVSESSVPRRPITMNFDRIPGANSHASALAELLSSTFAAPTTEEVDRAEETAMGLLRAIFSEEGSRSASAHRIAAMLHIDRHLRDPSLSVASVARAVGISERHLSRIFSETGTGIARVILDKRLDIARRILSTQGAPSIGEVAQQCGFSSHAHFTRSFRERFEETPGSIRDRAALLSHSRS